MFLPDPGVGCEDKGGQTRGEQKPLWTDEGTRLSFHSFGARDTNPPRQSSDAAAESGPVSHERGVSALIAACERNKQEETRRLTRRCLPTVVWCDIL